MFNYLKFKEFFLFVFAVLLMSLSINAKAALCSAYTIPDNVWNVMGDPRSNIVMIIYDGKFFGPAPFTTPSSTFVYQGVTYTRGPLLFKCNTGPSVFDYEVAYYSVSGPNTAPVYQNTFTESRTNNCPSGQSGVITQSRTFERWSDGSNKNYSAWVVSGNSCIANSIVLKPNRQDLCPVGYTGSIKYKWVLKYSTQNVQATDADGRTINYQLSMPYQEEVLSSNDCKLIPKTNIITKNTSETVSCDVYYGAAAGTYQGVVIKSGTSTSTYSSDTKETTTVFTPNGNVDPTGCKLLDAKFEYLTANCTSPELGVKTYYRYVTIVNGVPKEGDWALLSSSCTNVGAIENDNTITEEKKMSMLSNITLTTNQISANDDFVNFLKNLKTSSWNTNENYNLNLVINDLNTNIYNINKVSTLIKTYSEILGNEKANIRIQSLPRTLDKYIGNGDITVKNIESNLYKFKSSELVDRNIVLKYFVLSDDKTQMPIEKTIIIKALNNNVDIQNINN